MYTTSLVFFGSFPVVSWNPANEKTRIVGLRAEAAREVLNEPLGETKNLMQVGGAKPCYDGVVFLSSYRVRCLCRKDSCLALSLVSISRSGFAIPPFVDRY